MEEKAKIERKEFEPFDMTSSGFNAAKKWLKMMDLFDDYIDGAEDTSGFGVVSFANVKFKEVDEQKVGEA